ncbi:MAG: hypothetical protein U0640_11345 [Phycisphaerales bacterium]
MRRCQISFVGMIVAACAVGQTNAALVVTGQTGSLRASGTGGVVTRSAPALSPWTESITAGGTDWAGTASTITSWNADSLELYGVVNIAPGTGQPEWTSGEVQVDVDFTFTETTDTFVRFEFGVGFGETTITSQFAGHIVDLATGNEVILSDTFAPTTFAPGNYRISILANVGNIQANPELFGETNRTSFGGIYVLPTPGAVVVLAGGLGAIAGRRRR